MRRLPVPAGESEKTLLDYLAAFTDPTWDDRQRKEFYDYLHGDLRRFVLTLDLVPTGEGRLLEVGAHPYFTTLLLHRFRRYELALTNGWSSGETLLRSGGEEMRLPYVGFNLEQDELPYAPGSFDVGLCCEVIEHMTQDPYRGLVTLNRCLRPGGTLVLTTPNAGRFSNIMRTLVGAQGLPDQYSAYGPYGRHNREYAPAELSDLLDRAGFRVTRRFTADVAPNESVPVHERAFRALVESIRRAARRPDTLGAYCFFAAEKVREPNTTKPRWLYRSYPDAELG